MVLIFPKLSGPLMSSARKQNIIPKPLMTVCVCSRKKHSSKCHVLVGDILRLWNKMFNTSKNMFNLITWNALIYISKNICYNILTLWVLIVCNLMKILLKLRPFHNWLMRHRWIEWVEESIFQSMQGQFCKATLPSHVLGGQKNG